MTQLCNEELDNSLTNPTTWEWVKTNSSASDIVATLSSGLTEVRYTASAPQVEIDKMLLLIDDSCIPVSGGENCTTGQVDQDSDGDGIFDEDEQAIGDGDNNGDSTPDYQQNSVASVLSVESNTYITLEAADGCTVISSIGSVAVTEGADNDYEYPFGLLDFSVTCGVSGDTATSRFYFDDEYDTTEWQWRKQKTDGTYIDMSSVVSYDSASVAGKTVTTATLLIEDGSELDDDGALNAAIVDPSGPAILATGNLADTGVPVYAAAVTGIALALLSVATYRVNYRPRRLARSTSQTAAYASYGKVQMLAATTAAIGIVVALGATAYGLIYQYNEVEAESGTLSLPAVVNSDPAASGDSSVLFQAPDTTPPTDPSSAPDLQSGSDSGSNAADDITNAATLVFDVTCSESGSTLTLYSDQPSANTSVGSQSCASAGATTLSAPLSEATHTLSYTETDSDSNESGHSPTLSATIDRSNPTASITTPTDSQTLVGTESINATATDTNSVMQVEFFYDSTSLSTDTTAPYSYSWDTTAVTDSTYTLTVVATDAAGNTTTSSGVSVQVDNSIAASALVYEVGYDIFNSIKIQDASVNANSPNPRGMTFSIDGTKLYVVDQNNDAVSEYSLSTAFDVSTLSYVQSLDISAQNGNPRSPAISPDGTKLFVVGNAGDVVLEYTLTTPFDLSAANVTYVQSYDVTTEETSPTGIAFSNDGTRMFITGLGAGSVHEYSLVNPFDMTMVNVTYVQSFDVSSEDNTPQSLYFTRSGKKMFIIGQQNDAVVQYDLINPFDLSPGNISHNQTFAQSLENTPTAASFNANGTRMFITGLGRDDVDELTVPITNFDESAANDGSVDGSLDIALSGDTFNDLGGSVLTTSGGSPQVTIGNVPAGLTPVLSLTNNNTSVSLTFSGTAADHETTDSISDLTFVFNDSAFSGNDASLVADSGSGAPHSTGVGIDFDDSPDTTPPDNVTGFTATASTVSNEINLTWDTTSDNIGGSGVAQYSILRDGSPLVDVSAPALSHTDINLSSNTSYSYTIVAVDAVGNQSISPTPASDTTGDFIAPSPVTIDSPLQNDAVSGTVNISISAADDIGVTSVDILIDDVVVATDTTLPYSYSWDTTLEADGPHTITTTANDAAGNSTTVVATNVTVNNTDTTPPSNVSGFTATALDANTINLAWTSATDDVAVTAYEIAEVGQGLGLVATVNEPSTTFTHTGLLPGTLYSYDIVAVDAAGNKSVTATNASDTTNSDSEAPVISISTPTDLSTVSGDTLIRATATDNVGVTEVQFYIDGSPVGSPDTTDPYEYNWMTSSGSYPDGTYSLTAEVNDAAGNGPVTSTAVSVTVDNSTPTIINDTNYLDFDGNDDYINLGPMDEIAGSALTIEAVVNSSDFTADGSCSSGDCRIVSKASSTSSSDHYWMISTIPSGGDTVLRFRLRTGTTTTTLIASSGAMQADTSYHVAASYDGSTMRLFLDGVEVGSTAKTGALATNSGVDAWIGGNPDGASSRPWEGSIDDVRIWSIARNQSQIQTSMTTELIGTETGLVSYYKFNESTGQTVADSATSAPVNDVYRGSTTGTDTNDPGIVNNIPDTTPPSAPSNLDAFNPTDVTIDLSWTAATDDVEVSEYQIYQVIPSSVLIDTIPAASTAYTVTGLTPSTSYTYEVYAVDTSNNISATSSNQDSESTLAPDTTDPTWNPSANLAASSPTNFTVNLDWDAAIDNVSVAEYEIERALSGSGSYAVVDTVSAPNTSSTVVGLNQNTAYDFRIRAKDAAGNFSPYSNVATETTTNNAAACTYDGNPNNPFDDPNSLYNGNEGRYPVGTLDPGLFTKNDGITPFPTPLTTGICGVGLTPGDLTPSGGITITQDGAVIDGLDVDGCINVDADNVVIRNTRVTCSGSYGINLLGGHHSLTIQDSRIRGVGASSRKGILLNGPDSVLERLHVSGGADGIHAGGGSGTIVRDSYITGTYKAPGTHNDALQFRSGVNHLFEGNSILGPYQTSTSTLLLQAKAGNISGSIIRDNFFSGAKLYTSQASGYTMTNVLVENNIYETGSCFGACHSNSGGATKINNTLTGGGTW
ncbi:MAG: Ig-like domain-containing protein [Patescibacteria group bacterium]